VILQSLFAHFGHWQEVRCRQRPARMQAESYEPFLSAATVIRRS